MGKILDDILLSLNINEEYLKDYIDFDGARNKMDKISFGELADLYYDDPAGFSEDMLGFLADIFQVEIMESVRDNKRTSVRSGQGVGKTATVACIIIWYMMFRDQAKVIATAPTANQLNIVLWPEINKWLNTTIAEDYLYTTKTFMYRKGYEGTWFANAKTAAKKENMLGLHSPNMLIICDEAPGIDDDILEALLGTISDVDNRILFIGNPTRNSGLFFDSHHIMKDDFHCIHINAMDVLRTDKEQHKMMIKKYGTESNVVRVLIKGEFPVEEDDVFFPLYMVKNRMQNQKSYPKKAETIDIGVDCARYGDDETVIGHKIDSKIFPLLNLKGKDLMWTTGTALSLARELHKKYPQIIIPLKIDVGGLGGGVVDRLIEIKKEEKLDWLIISPVAFGKPIKHSYYYDSTTLMANIVKENLMSELELPEDVQLLAQMSSRKFEVMSSKGRIKLESKDQMKKRGLDSPDRADCVFLCCLPISAQFLRRVR